MENIATKSIADQIDIIEQEISLEEGYIEITSNPMKAKWRRRYIKSLKADLEDLRKQVKNV